MASNFTQIWTTFIQPLLTPLAALLGAASATYVTWRFGTIQAEIARQQAATASRAAETARKKLKLELFERRLSLYDKIYSFMRELPSLPFDTDFTPYFQDVREARWLFEKPLVDWLYMDLFETAKRYQVSKARGQSLIQSGTVDLAAITEMTGLQTEWTDEYRKLAEHFDPYLRLEH